MVKMQLQEMHIDYLVNAHLGECSLQDLVVAHCIVLCGCVEIHLQSPGLLKSPFCWPNCLCKTW